MLDAALLSARRRTVPDILGRDGDAARLRGEGTSARRAWRPVYVNRTIAADLWCAEVAAGVAFLLRYGPRDTAAEGAALFVALLLPLVWLTAMLVARCYEERFLWVGPEEFHRVFYAAMLLLAAVGTASWALRLEIARGFVVLAVPLTALLTLLQRYTRRRRLHRARVRGACLQTTLLVGHRNTVADLHRQISCEGYHGYRIVGVCLPQHPDDHDSVVFDGLPVLGRLDQVAQVVERYEIDTVALLPCPEIDGGALRRLGWQLEKTAAELVLAPAVTEIAGPRVRIRPVCGLPLMHVERPELRGIRRFTKAAFDLAAASSALLLLAPLLAAVALAVRLTSPGPVLFRQERIGRDGQTFTMLKFRSMVAGAERLVEQLVLDGDGNGVLFKHKSDPRVTRVGRLLRRYSIDELPQLWNVLRGDMSLVGPRPPLPSEVDRYGFDMHRRFLVKPGLTGLWQVSGRSDLSWDDSVRIDVRYVENWSLTFDFMILWKTVGAVLRGSGAY